MSRKEHIEIVLSGVNENVHRSLKNSSLYELLGKEYICSDIRQAVARSEEIINNKNVRI